MKIRTCIDALMRWSISRVGRPSPASGSDPISISEPPINIPSSIDDEHTRKLVAAVRFPLNSAYGINIHELQNVYEYVLKESTSAGFKGKPHSLLMSRLGIDGKVARYMFGNDAFKGNEKQLAEFAARTANMASEIFGCKLYEDRNGIVAMYRGEKLFGIESGAVVSRYTKGIPADFAETLEAMHTISPLQFQIGTPRLLNLRHSADAQGDDAVGYFLDCVVWYSSLGGRGASGHLIDLSTYSQNTPKATVRARVKSTKLPLTESVYRQGIYICQSADNPVISLKELLVPVVISSREYTNLFANPYGPARVTENVRNMLTSRLESFYAGQEPNLSEQLSEYQLN